MSQQPANKKLKIAHNASPKPWVFDVKFVCWVIRTMYSDDRTANVKLPGRKSPYLCYPARILKAWITNSRSTQVRWDTWVALGLHEVFTVTGGMVSPKVDAKWPTAFGRIQEDRYDPLSKVLAKNIEKHAQTIVGHALLPCKWLWARALV